MIDLSIVIVTYNSAGYIVPCLTSIFGQNVQFKFEVIVFDNNSSDETIDLIKKHFSEVRLFQNSTNIGFAAANNLAVGKSDASVLLFLNPDTKVADGSLGQIYTECSHYNEEKVILAPRQVAYDSGLPLNCGVGMDVFGFPITVEQNADFFYVDGAAIVISKNNFIDLGMFDEMLFLIHEDIDLSWRARLFGYKLLRINNALVYHKSGHSIGTGAASLNRVATSAFRRFYGERNNVRNLLKNYAFYNLIWVMPLVALTAFCEIIMFLILGEISIALSYVRAYIWNCVNVLDTIRMRKWVQSRRAVPDSKIMKNMYFGSAKLKLLLNSGVPSCN